MHFTIQTGKRQEIVDITAEVEQLVEQSKVKNGLCTVYASHATAAIIINENADPNICLDLLDALNKVFPDKAGYRHDRIDGNAGAHIKASVLGPQETVPVNNGRLLLGTWQSLMLVDLDGPRKRTIHVHVS